MFDLIGIPAVYGPVAEALAAAMERAIAVLGLGTVIALALAGLVIGVEILAGALERRMSDRGTRRSRPRVVERRRGKAYR